jgi:hypothetical protein
LIQVIGGGKVEKQWSPITLQGAGLFHMAMGAVLGIAAYGRTQEKMAGAAGGNGSTAPSVPSFTPPNTSSFGATSTPTPSFGGSAAPAFMPAPPPSFGSKPTGPGQTSFPEL